MRFTKMQGCGNDYVYVDGFRERVENPARTAQIVSEIGRASCRERV